MCERGTGSIINMSSISGLRPQREGMLYSMTKAALIMMTQSYALELGPKGVRVNAIAPGMIETALSEYYWKDESRRAQIEAQALASQRVTVTRFLSYAHSKDVVPTIKKLLSKRGEVVSDDRTNALIMLDIPQVFPEIDRLLTQLDRKTPEVEIEARVVAATRNFARDIGTQLGFAFGNGTSTAVGGATSVGTSPIVVTPTSGAPPPPYITSSGSTGIQIPLFSNLPAINPTSGLSLVNLGSNYRLDAILTAAESRGLLKILSRPRVVTQNNIQAVVRQGVRIGRDAVVGAGAVVLEDVPDGVTVAGVPARIIRARSPGSAPGSSPKGGAHP
jgi:type II secretory pathway component HofQ